MSLNLKQSTPILPSPYRLKGMGSLRLKGAGEVLLELDGSGQVTLEIRADVVAHYEGETPRRVARHDQLVWIGANGRLTIHGSDIEVRFCGGTVRADVIGHFDATVDGHGEIESRTGCVGWGLHPRTLRLGNGGVADVSAISSKGAAA